MYIQSSSQGYSKLVWAMVGLDSTGGVLVSMLLKYASNTLKNFAAPLGIIINVLLTRYRQEQHMFIYIYIYMYVCMYIYIERESKYASNTLKNFALVSSSTCCSRVAGKNSTHSFIYIYTCMYVCIYREREHVRVQHT